MDILRKAAQAALDAYDHHDPLGVVMADLRAALAQPEKFCDANCVWTDHHPDCALAQPVQVPVAWLRQRDSCLALNDAGLFGDGWTPLYTHPPQRKPLTEDEISEIAMDCSFVSESDTYFARAIENAHRIE